MNLNPAMDREAGVPLLAPSDPCIEWKDAATGDEDCCFPVCLRNPQTPPRAAIQRQFANEAGVDFNDVAVLARWGRIRTRQEVWAEYGRDRWEDEWLLKHKVGYYFEPKGYFYDEEVGRMQMETGDLVTRDGRHPPSTHWDRCQRVYPLKAPADAPEDWLPSEGDPVWELCAPDAPGAQPIFIGEER